MDNRVAGVAKMVMAPRSASRKHPFYVVCKCGLGCCVCGGRHVGVGVWGRGPLVMLHVHAPPPPKGLAPSDKYVCGNAKAGGGSTSTTGQGRAVAVEDCGCICLTNRREGTVRPVGGNVGVVQRWHAH